MKTMTWVLDNFSPESLQDELDEAIEDIETAQKGQIVDIKFSTCWYHEVMESSGERSYGNRFSALIVYKIAKK